MSALQIINRRRALGALLGTAAAAATRLHAATEEGSLFSAMGIAAPLESAARLRKDGADFLTLGTSELLVPDKDEAAFEQRLAALQAAPLPMLACNGFIRPAHLRCVGAEANHDAVLEWADIAFRRLRRARGKFIVFGSSGARRLPDGWSREKADAQFVSLLKRMGPLAEQQGVTVVVEQLQASECNYINRIGEAAELIRKAAHPHIRILADLFHMARMGDTPKDLLSAMDVVAHCEIAEREERSYPGVKGDDFRPFFRVLREARYHGAISIEGRGQPDQVAAAFNEIARQAATCL